MGILCCLAQGCRRPALLCSRDQSEPLRQRDKAPNTPLFISLFLFFLRWKRRSLRHEWINGRIKAWADGNADKEINVSASVDPFGTRSGLTKNKNRRPIAIYFYSILHLRYGLKYNSVSERCLENAWVLLSKINDFPSWKHIVYRPQILHNIKKKSAQEAVWNIFLPEKKVQPSAIWNCAWSECCDKLYSNVWSENNNQTKWGFQTRGGNRSCGKCQRML